MAGNVSRLGALSGKVFNTLRVPERLERQSAFLRGKAMQYIVEFDNRHLDHILKVVMEIK